MLRPLPKKYKKIIKFLPVLLSIAIAASYALFAAIKPANGPLNFSLFFNQKNDYNNILVAYVADGDTVKLEDGAWVRLIGIDAPECHDNEKLFRDARRSKKDAASIKRMGEAAAAFARDLLLNKKVRLEFDAEKRDKYNRLLAYVFLEDGAFANAKIIEAGYAKAMTIPPNVKYAELFSALAKEARTEKRGLWAGDF